jgi:subtilase family serine protease
VVVRNIGADPTGRFVVSVGERAFFVEAGLDAGEAATFDFPCRPGPLTAVADSTERIEEADEANNTLTAGPFDCASPSASPTTTATTTTQPPKLPDLVIRSVTEDSVTVVNVGRGRAGAFTVGVGKAGSFKVGGLDPGRGATFGFSCTGGTLVATADPSNQVAESNESNNTRNGGPFTCLADLIVSAIDRDSVTIANVGNGDAGASHVSIAGQVFNVPPIPDGQKVTVQYQCVGGLVDVVADVQDEVQESNESNNTGSADLGPC